MAGRSSRVVFVLALMLAGVLGTTRAWALGEAPGPARPSRST